MQVTKITAPPEAPTPAVHQLTEKQFYDEINYHRAEKMTKKMLDAGLITSEEHGGGRSCSDILLDGTSDADLQRSIPASRVLIQSDRKERLIWQQ